jgi:hypothetical protein
MPWCVDGTDAKIANEQLISVMERWSNVYEYCCPSSRAPSHASTPVAAVSARNAGAISHRIGVNVFCIEGTTLAFATSTATILASTTLYLDSGARGDIGADERSFCIAC